MTENKKETIEEPLSSTIEGFTDRKVQPHEKVLTKDIVKTTESNTIRMNVPEPSKFTVGKTGNFNKWIKTYERYARVQGINTLGNENKIDILLCFIDEEILERYSWIQELENYDKIILALTEKFGSEQDYDIEERKFLQMRQNHKETVSEFKDRLEKKAKMLNFSSEYEKRMISQLSYGVRDKNLKERIMMKRHKGLMRIYEVIKVFQELFEHEDDNEKYYRTRRDSSKRP